MNVRNNQVESVIQRAVQSMLTRGLNDPRVRGLISVTGVELSLDGKQAFINVSVLPPEHAELTMHGLHHAEKHIRFQVARDVRLRRLPYFTFRLDMAIKKQSEVLAAIAAAQRRSDGEIDEDVVDPERSQSSSEVSET